MPNPFNMRSVPEAPVPMVPKNLNLDPTNPHQMAGMLLAYLQDVYHGMGLQSRTINSLRASLENISTDDIDIEHNPTGGGSYWSIPAVAEEPRQTASIPTGTTVINALVKWNSGSSKYDWQEAVLTSGAWVKKTGGLSTGGYTSDDGTGDQPLAIHESGLQDLPDGIAVKISVVIDSAGDQQPIFEVPLQRDSSFTHRTTLAGSITLGSRADYSLTEAQLTTQANTVGMYNGFDLESQGTSIGWVRTEPFRPWLYVDSASTDGASVTGTEDMYNYVIDIEYDVLGRPVSHSKAFRYVMHQPGPCDTT